MIFGLIPAAGKSTRMGRPKLTLPLGGRTVLEHVVSTLKSAGVESVLVVVGPDGTELLRPAEAAGSLTMRLPAETPDMRATVEQGLAWLEAHFHPTHDDRWLLVPADHPALDAGVVRAVLGAGENLPADAVVVPTYRGRRGHPTLLGWGHVAAIRTWPAGQGLNLYLRSGPAAIHEVPVETPDVLLDLDTPEDYARCQARWAGPK